MSRLYLRYNKQINKKYDMKIRMHITQATVNYFLANHVEFKHIFTEDDGWHTIDVTVEDEDDIYRIYDAGRCYGRDMPNIF